MRIAIFTTLTFSLLILGPQIIASEQHVLRQARGATGPDFTMASNPSSISIGLGSSGTVSIIVTSLNSFSGTVTLSDAITPQGPTTSVSPQTLTLSPGATQTSKLTVSTVGASPFNSIGSFKINVTGVSVESVGTVTHSLNVALTVTSPSSGLGDVISLVAVGALAVAVVLLVYLARRRSVKN